MCLDPTRCKTPCGLLARQSTRLAKLRCPRFWRARRHTALRWSRLHSAQDDTDGEKSRILPHHQHTLVPLPSQGEDGFARGRRVAHGRGENVDNGASGTSPPTGCANFGVCVRRGRNRGERAIREWPLRVCAKFGVCAQTGRNRGYYPTTNIRWSPSPRKGRQGKFVRTMRLRVINRGCPYGDQTKRRCRGDHWSPVGGTMPSALTPRLHSPPLASGRCPRFASTSTLVTLGRGGAFTVVG